MCLIIMFRIVSNIHTCVCHNMFIAANKLLLCVANQTNVYIAQGGTHTCRGLHGTVIQLLLNIGLETGSAVQLLLTVGLEM